MQDGTIPAIAGARWQDVARTLITRTTIAQHRIAAGIALLANNPLARRAFAAMNEAVARAARRRNAGQHGDPAAQSAPKWRPFQLAFILLNLDGLTKKAHDDREVVDLLFFPTGGGKTEAYLGLAAYSIAHRRLTTGGLLGAGLVVMLLINTSLASGAFVVSELQTQKSALTVEAQALSKEVDAMSNPANLEAKARALGMKPSKNPVFLNLGDGSILGKPNGANVSPNAPLPKLATPADLTAVEAVDNAAADFPTTVDPNYDPAAADAAAAGVATAADSAWGEIVDVTDTPKAARAGKSGKAGKKAKIAKSDAGLSATPIG